MDSVLQLTLLLLGAAVCVVALFRKFNLPPLLGYLVVGIVLGPHSLGMASNTPGAQHLAEFGVVFLMFSIGLEFSLPKLKAMRRTVFGLGLAQVFLTIALTLSGAAVLAYVLPQYWQVSWQGAFALGGALAMSSTAIVMKVMAERLELESPHGREVTGILLFQDIAVVPLLILVPALAAPSEDLPFRLGLALCKAALVLFILLFVGQKLMRSWLHFVASRRSQELFMLNLLLITLGLAYITEVSGLSLALGAFVAGMLIAETEYRHQVEEDIKPFRDVLLGLFFVTIGMQLDLRVVQHQFPIVALLMLLPVLLKLVVITGLTRWFGAPSGTALRTGLYLASAGEFGLVLINQIAGLNLLDPVLLQSILAAMLLSMLLAPFMIQHADRIVLRVSSTEWMQRSLELHKIAARSIVTKKHVVICGFGRSGQHLARFLEQEQIPYVALDLDPDRVREAAAAGDSVVYGDAGRREALSAAGIQRAAAIVVTYTDTASALKVLHHSHELAAQVPVIVRTLDDREINKLQQAGAAEVVPEILEGSLMLASHALVLLGVPLHRVVRRVQQARDERYSMLRGYFGGQSDAADDITSDSESVRLHSIPITAGAACIGQTLAQLGLAAIGVEVMAIRRRDVRANNPDQQTVIQIHDVVVARGKPEALTLAEARLLEK
ncbi:monovalent cation:proton antiporter-2 (CPA2) family protein [Parvibium lacunae]|uniref:Potassium transporter n=1 Tax=Parvibium lacunae TaxID=1888893 RepID=A0A368L147_9BURK|nr:monovalent cation:proton antiporter-2 (CPA2) family protein [Parvibium lacunae]RCS56829.1 potassium transporter [Parvibium lacunae]